MALFTAAAVGIAGCPRAKPPAPPVVVGVILPLTGPQAGYGVSARAGVDLAAAELAAAGGIGGRALRVVVMDDQSDREVADSAAQRLIAHDRAALLVGEVSSSASLALAQVAERARVPMISPSATVPELTRQGPFVFRVCAPDPTQARAMARFATETLKVTRFGVLVDLGSTYSPGLAEAFAAEVGRRGGAVVARPQYSADDPDFEGPLGALAEAGAEAVYLPGYAPEVTRILAAARARGLEVVFLGGDGWDAVEVGAPEAEGHYLVSHFAPEAPGPEVAKFVAAYRAAYNEAPDAYAALGYDAIRLAAQAMGAAEGEGGDALQAALSGLRGFVGVTGPVVFDAHGDPAKSVVILKWAGGARQVVATVGPDDLGAAPE